MTPRISTGRERRVRQTEAVVGLDGEQRYLRHNEDGLMAWDEREGIDRRVATWRCLIDDKIAEAPEPHQFGYGLRVAMVLALRRPRGVVVVEGEYINGRVYPDNDAASYTAFGNRVKGLTDGHRVRVVVEKCDE